MPVSYQTEYSLGDHRGRIRRTYTGIPAYVMIAVDLFLIFTVDLVFTLLLHVLWLVLRLLTVVFYVLTIPFRLARKTSAWVEARSRRQAERDLATASMKPSWAAYHEI